MKATIPTLSKAGVISDPKQAMLYLFKSFLTIDKSVSNWWMANVHSLMFLVKRHAKSPEELRDAVDESLTQLFNVYFEDVKVQVDIESATELNIYDTPSINLKMALLVEDSGRTHQLSAVLLDAFKENDRMYNRVVFKEM